MIKPIDYLCLKINTLQDTELYRDYQQSFSDLQSNQDYFQNIEAITNIDKENNREDYFRLKQEITKQEIEFRHYERELNTYIKYIVNKYNQVYAQSNLEDKE